MKDFNYTDLIERYIEGSLSNAEVADFELQLSSNPDLKSELTLQKDIISSLQNARKSELKARLANIDVSTGLSTIQQIGIAAATLLTGTAIYLGVSIYSGSTNSLNSSTNNATISTEKITSDKTAAIETKESEIALISDILVLEKSPEKTIQEKKAIPEKKQITKTESISTPTDNLLSSNTFAMHDDDESNLYEKNAHSPENSIKNAIINNEKQTVPKIHAGGKGYFYKYNKEQLDLYGDFEGKSYYLYELKETNKLYLHFNNTYYEIEPSSNKIPLKEVKNQLIIENLKNTN